MAKIRLSLCIITKNNESQILDCLREFAGIADEIIVADIGSHDQTLAFAKKAGARVIQLRWNRDYSEVKNVCLEQAKGRWVFFVQAGETIHPYQLKQIASLLENPNAVGYLFHIDHLKYRISSPVQALRLIRNRDYRYKYRGFERIPDEQISCILGTGIRILQSADVTEHEDRLSLLEEDLGDHPDDSYLNYMYGIEQLNQQKYQDSLPYFNKAVNKLNPCYLFAPHLYKCLAWSLIALKETAQALAVLEEGIKLFPIYTDLLVLRGEVQRQLDQVNIAIEDMKNALVAREKPSLVVPMLEISKAVIYESMGEIHEHDFNYLQAIACYMQAYNLNTTKTKLLNKIGKLAEKGQSPILKDLLNAAIEHENPQELIQLMDVLLQHYKFADLLSYVNHLAAFVGKEKAKTVKYLCYIMLRKFQQAELIFATVNKEDPVYRIILMQKLVALWCRGLWVEAEIALKEIQQHKNIEQPLKDVYHQMHEMITQKAHTFSPLTEQQYDLVATVHNYLLWFGLKDPGQILLLTLLKHGEAQYVSLAEPWAETNDYDVLELIFSHIPDKESQLDYKRKITAQLLTTGFIQSAGRIKELGGSDSLGPLDIILWAKTSLNKLDQWTEKVLNHIGLTSDIHQIPETCEALRGFSRRLIPDFNPDKMSCSEIQLELGNYYHKADRNSEAITAYLRALQWDPQNGIAQDKMLAANNRNTKQFLAHLHEGEWAGEGKWFKCKQDFVNFCLAIIQFKKRQFQQASESFSKIETDVPCYPLVISYVASSLWLAGKETQAQKKLEHSPQAIPSFVAICQAFILEKLVEGQQRFPHSELIKKEIKRMC